MLAKFAEKLRNGVNRIGHTMNEYRKALTKKFATYTTRLKWNVV